MQEVVDVLERRQLPYIVAFTVAAASTTWCWRICGATTNPRRGREVGKVISGANPPRSV
jgi:hypothetical protein